MTIRWRSPNRKRDGVEYLSRRKDWVVQSLSDMKGDFPPPFSKEGYKSPDLVEHNMVALFDHTPDTRLHSNFVQEDMAGNEDNFL
ncbi:hypothetical protein H5410_055816 [Solanum commersonii]|uniref:Uncharacterized protein n=1 Tax=Solanum commersonii TaxID=4109 RepID=A0A9J5WJF9_SOLCO|nr:hypothetical protein H5410_055816 [Solanum commersonii]